MATKPTKQQVAQAKARAGGNNPIKVTSSGLKKLGTAAAIAASLTPVGRGIKAVGIAGKMAKTVDARRKFNAATEKRILDNQVKKSVKVLPRTTAPKTDLSNRGAGKKNQRKADAIKKEATKENFYERIRNPIKINSAKPTKGSSDNFVEVPVKDSKYGEGPGVFVSRSVAARKPTRKPTRNPENPPKGTVVIKSSSPSYLRKKAIPMNKPVVKKTPRKFAPPKKK